MSKLQLTELAEESLADLKANLQQLRSDLLVLPGRAEEARSRPRAGERDGASTVAMEELLWENPNGFLEGVFFGQNMDKTWSKPWKNTLKNMEKPWKHMENTWRNMEKHGIIWKQPGNIWKTTWKNMDQSMETYGKTLEKKQ